MAPSSKRVGNREGRRGSRLLRAALFTLAALLAVALVARILAPHVIQRSINHRLDEIPGYGGRVGEVSLHLWRGAYRLTEIRIVKRNGKVREPFFAAKEIDLSIAWRELVRRRFVADIRITDGQLVFLRGPTEEESQLTADSRWQDAINDIFPIDITHLVIDGGVIEFIDTTHEPRVDIAVRDLRVVATGLRNRPAETGQPFPAYIDLSGRTAGDGDLRLYAKLDPLADQAHFQLAHDLRHVVGVDARRSGRIESPERAVQRPGLLAFARPQPRAQCGVPRGSPEQPFKQRPQIESGAAGHNRQPAAARNRRQGGAR